MANEAWTTSSRAAYIGRPKCTQTVDEAPPEAGTWTTPSYFATGEVSGRPSGIDLSVSGTFVGTVTLQRSFDGTTWHDIETYTGPEEKVIEYANNSVMLRLGVKETEWTSGDIVLRLTQAG